MIHHAPADCPVCGAGLITTRKGCLSCGSELVGEFASCQYCVLEAADLEVLRVFLTSRGNMRELEKHLGVSYPTARARYTALLAKLGLEAVGIAEEARAPEQEQATSAPSMRDQILARVANGDLSAADAAALLAD